MTDVFEKIESEVQSYARSFPALFETAEGVYLYDDQDNQYLLYDDQDNQYLDFLAGAGTLNYGHNHPVLKKALLNYIENDGITHGLDMHTKAKEAFLQVIQTHIFKPRNLKYRVQFTGPAGTNAVEAALLKQMLDDPLSDTEFAQHITARSQQLEEGLLAIANSVGQGFLEPKGRGMMRGLSCPDGVMAGNIASNCFKKGLIIESSGSEGQVIKCLCPLIITESELAAGLKILRDATEEVIAKQYKRAS